MDASKIAEAMKNSQKEFDPKVFKDFLEKRKAATRGDYTHTSFKGGKYYIEAEDNDDYLRLYKYFNGKSFGMVEFPKTLTRYIRFDLDLVYDGCVKITKGHICKIVACIKTEINKYYDVDYDIYVLMRNKKTFHSNGVQVKNGIHIQIPDIVTRNDYITKFIRKELISNKGLEKVFKDMEVVNPITDIIDECVYTSNGWMQYGSDKGTESSNAYQVKYVVNKDNEIRTYKEDNKNLVELFSLRNKMVPTDINQKGLDIVEKIKNEENEIGRTKIIAQQKKQEEIQKRKAERKYNDVVDKDFIKELVHCLHHKRANDYKTWSELCWCLKSIDDGLFEIFDEFSKKSDKYNDSSVEKFWDTAKEGNYTMGTLRFWARNDDIEKYDEICEKYKKQDNSSRLPKEWDDDTLAKDFSERYNDKFIYKDKKMYYFNGIYWEIDDEFLHIKSFISNTYRYELVRINSLIFNLKLEKTNDKDEIELITKQDDLLKKCIVHIRNDSKKTNIAKCCKLYLMNKEIKFDNKPYLFCFENKVYDLTKGEFIKPNPLDYMTITTGYNYEEDEDLENKLIEIDKLLSTIFPIKNEKEYFCRILSTSMCGIQTEKLFILNGSGRNGKGVIDELTMEMVGNYGLDGNICVITDKKKGGASVEFNELNKKRLIIFKEPPEDSKMNMATIKEITGSGKINARTLYKDKTDTIMNNTTFLEVNQRLEIGSKISNADIDRLVDIFCRSTFKSKSKLNQMKEQLGEIPEYHYEGNKFYKTQEFTEQYKIPLFHYLQKYFRNVYDDNDWELDVGKPQSIIDRTNAYLQANDLLFSWFKDVEEYGTEFGDKWNKESLKYSKGTKFDTISIRELLNDFKKSDIYENLTKAEKRKYTNKTFKEEIMTNEYLKIYYKKRYQFVIDGNKKDINNCIVGFKRETKHVEQVDQIDDTDEY